MIILNIKYLQILPLTCCVFISCGHSAPEQMCTKGSSVVISEFWRFEKEYVFRNLQNSALIKASKEISLISVLKKGAIIMYKCDRFYCFENKLYYYSSPSEAKEIASLNNSSDEQIKEAILKYSDADLSGVFCIINEEQLFETINIKQITRGILRSTILERDAINKSKLEQSIINDLDSILKPGPNRSTFDLKLDSMFKTGFAGHYKLNPDMTFTIILIYMFCISFVYHMLIAPTLILIAYCIVQILFQDCFIKFSDDIVFIICLFILGLGFSYNILIIPSVIVCSYFIYTIWQAKRNQNEFLDATVEKLNEKRILEYAESYLALST